MRSGLTAMRSRMAPVPCSDAEERASAAVHAVGAIVGAVAVTFLIAMAAATGSLLAVAACAVYGGAAVLTLLSSALYHSAPRSLPPVAVRAEEGRRTERLKIWTGLFALHPTIDWHVVLVSLPPLSTHRILLRILRLVNSCISSTPEASIHTEVLWDCT